MLIRVTLAASMLLVLSSFASAQKVASVEPTSREKSPETARREALKDYKEAVDSRDFYREVGAAERLMDAESKAPAYGPDIDRSKITGADVIDKLNAKDPGAGKEPRERPEKPDKP